ncbi:MAG TPA: malate dehydrogenase, partial [Candidatus Tenderia electrophaga]|nr:malate dehydrogenase [Candidatus Tenderia electrophaga]
GKTLEQVKIVCVGAGAAGIASMRLLVTLGMPRQNLTLVDRTGVVHSGRDDLNEYKQEFARDTDERSLSDAMNGADVFIGVSGPNVLSEAQLLSMAARPVVFALSNPDPEISPEVAWAARDDLIMATGRSDYPNQVNNVLGFPFIFRGALDVRAARINAEMAAAAVHALRDLTREPVPQVVLDGYGLKSLSFGPDYIIPKPTDERLIDVVPAAVARAAVDSGVARLAYPDHYPKL